MYLARNSNGCLFLHEQKPLRVKTNKDKGYWESNGTKMPISLKTPYPRWSDEPLPVRLQADWITDSIND